MAISIQVILGVIALLGGFYAGYDLLFGVENWRKAVPSVIARSWVCALLAMIGIDQVFFGQNAVLQIGFLLGLPLLAIQIGFIVSLGIAVYLWSSE